MGKPSFPTPSPSGWVGAGAAPARMRAGGPRTPAPARGRGWAGAARAQGHGETGFPHTLAQRVGGSGRRPRADAGRRPAHPGPGPREGLGGRRPHADAGRRPAHPGPGPREGLGGRRPRADAGRRPAHPGPGPREGLGGRRPRADAGRRAAVTIVRRVLPPLPASPRWGEAPGSRPQRGRSNVNIGEPASPYPRPQKGFGGLRPQAGVWGNRVSPPLPEGLGREGDGLSINNPL